MLRQWWLLSILAGCSAAEPAQTVGTWTRIPAPTTADLERSFFLNERQGWVVGRQGTVLGTDDGGRSWQLLSDVNLSQKRSSFRCEHLLFTDERHGMIGVCCGVCSTAGTWLMLAWGTVDGGHTWTSVEREQAEKTPLMNERRFETCRGEMWTVFHQEDVAVRKIGEQYWHGTMQLLPGKEGWYRDVWFSSPQTGCLVGTGGLHRTEDGGATWVRLGADRMGDRAAVVRMTSDAQITVAAGPHLYGSSDGGATWTEDWIGTSDIVGLTYLSSKVGIAIGKGGLILRRSTTK